MPEASCRKAVAEYFAAGVTLEGVEIIDCNSEGKSIAVRAFWNPAPVPAVIQS